MATVRPIVSIYAPNGRPEGTALMPSVFQAPLRVDLVRYVFTNLAKNSRQSYAVSPNAGYQTSAESWGTGRAVSRIPRVKGGGTHAAGQCAFGNQCRGGGMFAPNKTWRRWHRKVNITEKRHAVATAIAATALPSLVAARGHVIDQMPELPMVVRCAGSANSANSADSDSNSALLKTSQAVKLLQGIGCGKELERVAASKKLRCGKGKYRNRRYVMRKGPLVIYAGSGTNTSANSTNNTNSTNSTSSSDDAVMIQRAFRNIPGVDLCQVDRLNLLKLAPGGTLGRLCIWTPAAFQQLQALYGKAGGVGTAALKKGYHLQRPCMANADLGRIINSTEIQSVVRPMMTAASHQMVNTERTLAGKAVSTKRKLNLLKNRAARCHVNPAFTAIAKKQKNMQKCAKKDIGKDIGKEKAAQRRVQRMAGKKYMQAIRKAHLDKANEMRNHA